MKRIPGLTIDPDGPVPVYRQIADGVRNAACDGRLAPGHRLPPTRDLAHQLGVSRQTVVAAYDHLATEGWVHGRTGKGTFLVTSPEPTPPGREAEGGWLPAFARAVEAPKVGGLLSVYRTAIASEGISFAGSYPAPELLPVDAFARAIDRALAEDGRRLLVYGPTAGQLELRETIANRMRLAGSRVGTDDVLVTNGAQQAIELVFHTFLERGDTVVIEEPTYTGALSVLASIGARIVSVPVDERGLRTDLLAIALERHRPRLLYVQPTSHNPTTAVMDERSRRELLALAARNRCLVVEDDWASGLQFEGEPPPTLHALDPERVIHLSTFSKKLLPGLRIGWAVAPPVVIERLVALKQIRDCGTSPLLQGALQRFLEDGGLDAHLKNALPSYRARRDAMLAALERHFPVEASWRKPAGGLFVWVALPVGLGGEPLFQAARERGVVYSRGELFHSSGGGGHTLRLTYSTASPEMIERGVAILGELIRERRPERPEHRERPVESMPIL
jgi:GntR family transcriptional regulator/MocR family aminotransferase